MNSIYKIELKRTRVQLEEHAAEYEKYVKCSKDVLAIAWTLLDKELVEVMLVILLNTKNKIIGFSEIGRGSIDKIAIKSCDVFRSALHLGAVAIVMVHNHPSGEPSPSSEDIVFTRRVKKAGEILGVQLLDHIIIAEGKYSSLLDMGILNMNGEDQSK